jgi:IclR helix-turn-helix domain
MPDTIDSARSLIEARLRQLDAEAERLGRALHSLGEGRSTKPRGRPRRKASSRKAAKRAPRGQRRQQFLAALEKSPGAKASEIAKQLGISPNQAHTLARRLHKQKAIRRSGRGYRLNVKAD